MPFVIRPFRAPLKQDDLLTSGVMGTTNSAGPNSAAVVRARNRRALKRNPRARIQGLHQIPYRDDRRSDLSAGDCSNRRLRPATFTDWLINTGGIA